MSPASSPHGRLARVTRRAWRAALVAIAMLGTACADRVAGAGGPAQDPGPRTALTASQRSTILRALARHPVVAITDAHGLQQLGDFYVALVSDAAIQNVVQDVVVEFANPRYQSVIDRFVSGDSVSDAELRTVWRNTAVSPIQQWDSRMYEALFRAVRRVNAGRPRDRQLRVLAGDPPIDWSAVRSLHDVINLDRDRSAADVIAREVLSRRRKALALFGGLHLARRLQGRSVTRYVESATPAAMYIVSVHTGLGPRNDELEPALLGSAHPGDVISLDGHPLGQLDANEVVGGMTFDQNGRPVKLFPDGTRVGETADAVLFLGRRDDLLFSPWAADTYRDPTYVAELDRRHRLLFGRPIDVTRLQAPPPVKYHIPVPPGGAPAPGPGPVPPGS